ncbi:MAG: DotU family type IV/VI secretion system protein [Alphaproteobacteria bacterium]|nr:DotU family type IV/VI secretion system protein [Alphaproteobacteria bacterium]
MSARSASVAAATAMGGAGAYVLDQFREFYDEVMVLRDAALRSGRAPGDYESFEEEDASDGPPPPPLPGFAVGPPPLPGEAAPPLPEQPVDDEDEGEDPVPKAARPSVGLSAEEALQKLQTLLEMQALEAGHRGGEYGVLYYREAQYVMAALADEIFINLDWAGRNFWRNDLLETRLFGSYNAGDVVFKRLEKLLQTGDRVQAEIAVVYLMALTLGFRGRYAGGRHEARIAEYRKQLYYYIFQKRPDLGDPATRIVPEAYQHTHGNVTARLLPSPTRWFWALGAAVLIYLIASHFVFHDVMAPLIEALNLEEQNR